MAEDQYRCTLIRIGTVVDDDLLRNLKYLCAENLSEREKQSITTFIEFIEALERNGQLDLLKNLFEGCRRFDLARALETGDLPDSVNSALPVQESQQNNEFAACQVANNANRVGYDIIDFLSKRLGNDWRKLARRLGFTEPDIQNIDYKNNRNLQEMCIDMLSQWLQREGRNATVPRLVLALKKADLNLFASQIQELMAQ